MSELYIYSQSQLEDAFTEMGFVEGTGADSGKWFYENDTIKHSYFVLNYYSSTTVTPIVYYDSVGTANNMMDTMTASTQAMKIEYYKLYGGGVIFRAGRDTATSIVSSAYNRMLCFAIFPTDNNTSWNVIFDTGNATTYTPKLDTLDGAVQTLYYFTFSNAVTTMSAVNITRLYDNRNGFIDGEVYINTVPLGTNTPSTLFATVNNIEYVLGFGRSNGNESRYAFRLADVA